MGILILLARTTQECNKGRSKGSPLPREDSVGPTCRQCEGSFLQKELKKFIRESNSSFFDLREEALCWTKEERPQ